MSELFCEIKLSDIDLTDDRYKLSFVEEDITFLAHSIKQAGLIFPPAVRQLHHKFIIISGFNRIRAHLFNNESKILVYKVNPDESDYQCLLKSITALAFKRPLTHAELILSTRRLSRFLDEKQIAEKSSAIFNMEVRIRFIKDLLILGTLPDSCLDLIHNGRLSLKSAKRISAYEKETIAVFLTIFSRIKASNNKQLEIIQHIMEITARDGMRPNHFFLKPEIQNILFDDNKNPGLKTEDLRTCLFKLRYPTLFMVQKSIREKIRSMKFDPKIKFAPPENFESQNYFISFQAKNYNEFSACVQALNDTLENKELKEIFHQ